MTRSENPNVRPVIRLRDGAEMPALGLGTWKSATGAVGRAVSDAIAMGYRHVDCAPIYGNEPEIGRGIADALASGTVRREALWITSKLWNDRHEPHEVVPALEETLADLGLEYLDLYLVHWPVALKRGVSFPRSASDMISLERLPIAETWSGMEAAVDQGLCRHIGVSNFSVSKLDDLGRSARIPPSVNQIELHPYLQQNEMLDYCDAHEIALTAYSPFGSPDRSPGLKPADEPDLLADPVLAEIAGRHGATPAQVILAWDFARGTSAIPKSVTAPHLAENLAAADLALTDDEMRAIAGLERRRRFLTGSFWELPGGPYALATLWD